jgi:5-methylthioadenosine/S-adenosylhomocysteine deaminase
VLSSCTLLIHGVGFNPEDLALIRRRGATVATCPRSNLLLGCGLPDYAAWKRAGVSFTYGTDSLASVPSFDLFAEARAVRAVLPESPETILRRLTLGGAEALGLGDITGSLEPGKAADIALVRLPGGLGSVGDIVTLASAGHVKATMVAGNFLYREPNSARYFPGRRERPAAPRGELRR